MNKCRLFRVFTRFFIHAVSTINQDLHEKGKQCENDHKHIMQMLYDYSFLVYSYFRREAKGGCFGHLLIFLFLISAVGNLEERNSESKKSEPGILSIEVCVHQESTGFQ